MSWWKESYERLLKANFARREVQRLAAERPRPSDEFQSALRAQLATRWATAHRPRNLRARVFGLMAIGCLLLIVAVVIAAS